MSSSCRRSRDPRPRNRSLPSGSRNNGSHARSQMHVVRLIALCAVVALGQAATQPPPQQPPPRFRAGANLVRVDVYATKDAVPVQDLTAADFEIAEDNAPQKVDT